MSDEIQQRELKAPTTYEEQIQKFKDREMLIENESEAITILKRIHYYRFTAYALTFKQDTTDHYIKGTTFNKVYKHYLFDAALRNHFMKIVEYIEIALRSQLSYKLAHSYGSQGYLDGSNFVNPFFHQRFVEDLQRCIQKQSKEVLIAHHRENYQDRYPIWAAFEVSTISMMSSLYKNFKTSDKKSIAREYYPSTNISYKELENWFHVLTVFRNRCAHYSRLFNYRIPVTIRYTRTDESLGLDRAFLYGAIYNSKYLVNDRPIWVSWVTGLSSLIEAYNEVDITLLGFPRNWENLLQK
ncbi:Abi family protein [Paenibacillus tundrae]